MIFFALIDLLVFIIPIVLFSIGFFSFFEFALFLIVSVVLLLSMSYRKIEFPAISTEDNICILLAPEESSSQFANRFIRKACKLSHEYRDYKYIAIGTPSLTEGTRIHLSYDISRDMLWGAPNLQQLLTMYFVFIKFTRFIIRYENNIKSVISYSSPDVTSRLFNYISKRTSSGINFIASGVPEKEVLIGEIGKQTENIFNNARRVILPYSGGRYDQYYSKLKDKGLWSDEKVLHCQSSFIMEYIYNAKAVNVDLENNTDILMMLGSRHSELTYHYKVASTIIKKFTNSKYRIVFLCSSDEIVEKLKTYTNKYQNVEVLNQKDYNYENAKLAIIKSGAGLIKPILYGIPTIPFYIPNFRTKLYVKWYIWRKHKEFGTKFNKALLLLPNLITNTNYLIDDFMGKVNHAHLSKVIDDYLNKSNKDTEHFRILFAKEFLQIKSEVDTFSSLIDKYLTSSTRNLASIKKRLIEDAKCDITSQVDVEEWFERYDLYVAYKRCGIPDKFYKEMSKNNIKLNDAEGIIVASEIKSDIYSHSAS